MRTFGPSRRQVDSHVAVLVNDFQLERGDVAKPSLLGPDVDVTQVALLEESPLLFHGRAEERAHFCFLAVVIHGHEPVTEVNLLAAEPWDQVSDSGCAENVAR